MDNIYRGKTTQHINDDTEKKEFPIFSVIISVFIIISVITNVLCSGTLDTFLNTFTITCFPFINCSRN